MQQSYSDHYPPNMPQNGSKKCFIFQWCEYSLLGSYVTSKEILNLPV